MDAPGDLPFPHVSQAYLIERHVPPWTARRCPASPRPAVRTRSGPRAMATLRTSPSEPSTWPGGTTPPKPSAGPAATWPALHHSRTHSTIITTAAGNRSQGTGQLPGRWTAPGAMPDSSPDINDDRLAVRASRSLAPVPAGTQKGVARHGRERTVPKGPSSAAGCPGR
jgi:hypothetical protein